MRTAQSKNPEDAGCDHAATGSSTETVWGERLDAAIAEDTALGSFDSRAFTRATLRTTTGRSHAC